MEAKLNKAQPILKRTWFRYLGGIYNGTIVVYYL